MRIASSLAKFAHARDLVLDRTPGTETVSVYSRDGKYRYCYLRIWSRTGPLVLWVMLNPGTGDTEDRRRNTLERCIAWSKEWGYSGLLIGNAFAIRAKSAKLLKGLSAPVGPHNDDALRLLTSCASETIAAWGSKGKLHRRDEAVSMNLVSPKCLGITLLGQPRHPLYLLGGSKRVTWHLHK